MHKITKIFIYFFSFAKLASTPMQFLPWNIGQLQQLLPTQKTETNLLTVLDIADAFSETDLSFLQQGTGFLNFLNQKYISFCTKNHFHTIVQIMILLQQTEELLQVVETNNALYAIKRQAMICIYNMHTYQHQDSMPIFLENLIRELSNLKVETDVSKKLLQKIRASIQKLYSIFKGNDVTTNFKEIIESNPACAIYVLIKCELEEVIKKEPTQADAFLCHVLHVLLEKRLNTEIIGYNVLVPERSEIMLAFEQRYAKILSSKALEDYKEVKEVCGFPNKDRAAVEAFDPDTALDLTCCDHFYQFLVSNSRYYQVLKTSVEIIKQLKQYIRDCQELGGPHWTSFDTLEKQKKAWQLRESKRLLNDMCPRFLIEHNDEALEYYMFVLCRDTEKTEVRRFLDFLEFVVNRHNHNLNDLLRRLYTVRFTGLDENQDFLELHVKTSQLSYKELMHVIKIYLQETNSNTANLLELSVLRCPLASNIIDKPTFKVCVNNYLKDRKMSITFDDGNLHKMLFSDLFPFASRAYPRRSFNSMKAEFNEEGFNFIDTVIAASLANYLKTPVPHFQILILPALEDPNTHEVGFESILFGDIGIALNDTTLNKGDKEYLANISKAIKAMDDNYWESLLKKPLEKPLDIIGSFNYPADSVEEHIEEYLGPINPLPSESALYKWINLQYVLILVCIYGGLKLNLIDSNFVTVAYGLIKILTLLRSIIYGFYTLTRMQNLPRQFLQNVLPAVFCEDYNGNLSNKTIQDNLTEAIISTIIIIFLYITMPQVFLARLMMGVHFAVTFTLVSQLFFKLDLISEELEGMANILSILVLLVGMCFYHLLSFQYLVYIDKVYLALFIANKIDIIGILPKLNLELIISQIFCLFLLLSSIRVGSDNPVFAYFCFIGVILFLTIFGAIYLPSRQLLPGYSNPVIVGEVPLYTLPYFPWSQEYDPNKLLSYIEQWCLSKVKEQSSWLESLSAPVLPKNVEMGKDAAVILLSYENLPFKTKQNFESIIDGIKRESFSVELIPVYSSILPIIEASKLFRFKYSKNIEENLFFVKNNLQGVKNQNLPSLDSLIRTLEVSEQMPNFLKFITEIHSLIEGFQKVAKQLNEKLDEKEPNQLVHNLKDLVARKKRITPAFIAERIQNYTQSQTDFITVVLKKLDFTCNQLTETSLSTDYRDDIDSLNANMFCIPFELRAAAIANSELTKNGYVVTKSGDLFDLNTLYALVATLRGTSFNREEFDLSPKETYRVLESVYKLKNPFNFTKEKEHYSSIYMAFSVFSIFAIYSDDAFLIKLLKNLEKNIPENIQHFNKGLLDRFLLNLRRKNCDLYNNLNDLLSNKRPNNVDFAASSIKLYIGIKLYFAILSSYKFNDTTSVASSVALSKLNDKIIEICGESFQSLKSGKTRPTNEGKKGQEIIKIIKIVLPGNKPIQNLMRIKTEKSVHDIIDCFIHQWLYEIEPFTTPLTAKRDLFQIEDKLLRDLLDKNDAQNAGSQEEIARLINLIYTLTKQKGIFQSEITKSISVVLKTLLDRAIFPTCCSIMPCLAVHLKIQNNTNKGIHALFKLI